MFLNRQNKNTMTGRRVFKNKIEDPNKSDFDDDMDAEYKAELEWSEFKDRDDKENELSDIFNERED